MRSLAALLALVGCLVLTASATAAPTPDYTVAPSPPVQGQEATFTSTSTATPFPDPPPDPLPDPLITKVEWDFFGSPSFEEEGTSVTPPAYGSPGDKTFRMRVTDWTGEVTTSQFTVTVAAPPPPPNQSPVARFFLPSQLAARQGERVSLESFSYRPRREHRPGRVGLRRRPGFDDGDGNETDDFGGFTYQLPGTKTIRLKVTDDDGATSVLQLAP